MLALSLGDEAYPARVGDDHLVTEVTKQPVDPGGVRAYLEHHASRRQPTEALLQRWCAGLQPFLSDHRAALVEQAEVRVQVADVHPDGDEACSLHRFLLCGSLLQAGLLSPIGPTVVEPGIALAALYVRAAREGPGLLITALITGGPAKGARSGFAPLDDVGTPLLFRFVAAAYERRSLGVVNHWPFEQSGRFLPEPTTAVSLLDRLLHHAVVVTTEGESYRMNMKEARAKGGPTVRRR